MAEWGTELWDQFHSVLKYEERSAGFCETLENFIKERSYIEEEYAKALRRLVKSVQQSLPIDQMCRCPPATVSHTLSNGSSSGGSTTGYTVKSLPNNANDGDYSKQPNRDYFHSLSFINAFAQIVREHQDIASQHELIAENLRIDVLEKVQNLAREIRERKRRSSDSYKERKKELEKIMEEVNKAFRAYCRAFRISANSCYSYQRANEDINQSRAQVEKARQSMCKQSSMCDQVYAAYKDQLSKFNDAKSSFYREDLVHVFNELHEFDDKKINQLRGCYDMFIDAHSHVMPRIKDCLTGMRDAVGLMSFEVDSARIVDHFKSGYPYPPDQEPMDLRFPEQGNGILTVESTGLFGRKGGTVSSSAAPQGVSFASKIKTIRRVKRLINPKKKDEYSGIDEQLLELSPADFDDLPPAQRLKRCQQIIDDIKKRVETKMQEREALEKMQLIYSENPKFGESDKIGDKVQQTDLCIVKLNSQMKKFELVRDSIVKGSSSNESSNHTDDSVKSEPVVVEPIPAPQPVKVPSPPEQEKVTVVGNAVTQYAFDAVRHATQTKGTMNPVNMLSFEAGDEMDLLEPDLGDGWIKVMRPATREVGFVPSSYCHIHMFDRIVVDMD